MWGPRIVEDFQKANNSDECSMEQEPAGRRRWVVSTPGKREVARVCQYCKAPPSEIDGVGCFWAPPTNGSVYARVHRDLLGCRLLPVLEGVWTARNPPFFQQDNAKSTPRRSPRTSPILLFHPVWIRLITWTFLERHLWADYPASSPLLRDFRQMSPLPLATRTNPTTRQNSSCRVRDQNTHHHSHVSPAVTLSRISVLYYSVGGGSRSRGKGFTVRGLLAGGRSTHSVMDFLRTTKVGRVRVGPRAVPPKPGEGRTAGVGRGEDEELEGEEEE